MIRYSKLKVIMLLQMHLLFLHVKNDDRSQTKVGRVMVVVESLR